MTGFPAGTGLVISYTGMCWSTLILQYFDSENLGNVNNPSFSSDQQRLSLESVTEQMTFKLILCSKY